MNEPLSVDEMHEAVDTMREDALCMTDQYARDVVRAADRFIEARDEWFAAVDMAQEMAYVHNDREASEVWGAQARLHEHRCRSLYGEVMAEYRAYQKTRPTRSSYL